MGQLTTEQMLLLNNLMYMNGNEPLSTLNGNSGKTLGDVINQIDTSRLSSDTEYTTFTNGSEWNEIIRAVKADAQLMNTRIIETYTDGKGANSALFANGDEAVIVFQGTASAEWKDNFTGGAGTNHPDGVSTAQQQSALDWYQSLKLDGYDTVTVSGHSKGGNKAKYITVMDSSVDRCVSFDGQGFSDEFIDKYRDRIADCQDKISNHNASGDYVNILLNDIGERHYYKGYYYGNGKFAENHCPNTMMHIGENGDVQMDETTQDSSVQKVDEFFNSYLRTLSDSDKRTTMDIVGDLAQLGFTGGTPQEMLEVLLNGDNTDNVADLLAYLIKYEQVDPELAEALKNILNSMGMESVSDIVDTVTEVMNNKHFDKLLDAVDWVSGGIPNYILDIIRKYLKEKCDIGLSREDMRKLLGIIHSVNVKLPNIAVDINNGADKRVESSSGSPNVSFDVKTSDLKRIVIQMQEQIRKWDSMISIIDSIYPELKGVLINVKPALVSQKEKLERNKNSIQSMSVSLDLIARNYILTESHIVEMQGA